MKTFKQFVKEELKVDYGAQSGSNLGGKAVDTDTGQEYYVKHYNNADQAKVEALTGKIYKHMGIHTIEPEYREINGKPSIATKWNPNLGSMNPHDFEHVDSNQASQLAKMYHGAILTKNWDIVGLEHDNIMKDKTGNMVSVDHGGSFHFRARGGPKEYGPDINEHESLRNNNEASGHVFGSVFKNHPEAERQSIESVKNMDDDYVHDLFKNSGLSNWQDLHRNFMERKNKLINKY